MSEQIVCKQCGSINYRIEQAGPHHKAVCNDCDAYIKFVKQGIAAPIENDNELASDKQINYIKSLIAAKKIGKRTAGEIIKLLAGA